MSKCAVVVATGATKAEKLGTATDMSLDRVLAFLGEEIDPREDAKLFALQINTALSTIANQIRLESAALQTQAGIGGMDDKALDERLVRALSRLEVYGAEEEAAGEREGGPSPCP